MKNIVRTARATVRSLRISYGDRQHAAAMDDLYRHFVKPGDLVFDVGAHAGNRTASFLRLGAKVVAIEPQPAFFLTLNVLYGWRKNVVVLSNAVSSRTGQIQMMINIDNPTISTASSAFVKSAQGAGGWSGEKWDKSLKTEATTLDNVIRKYGCPSFIKIDIEGFEAEALEGLSTVVSAISFEFTTIQLDVASTCIERCVSLGYNRFNAAIGESQKLEGWRSAESIKHWLFALPHSANSGDIYTTRA